MTQYPTEMPLDAIRSLATMIRAKDYNVEEFGLNLWNLQGYAQSKLLGTTNRVMGSVNTNPSDMEALDALDSLQSEQSQVMGASPKGLFLSILLRWALNKALRNV
jgi:hypothetical protein